MMACIDRMWNVVIAPYSLAEGKVGEPVGTETRMPLESDVQALIRLGTLIFGADHRMPQRIAGTGNGYRIYVESPEGDKLPYDALYERVKEFVGEDNIPRLEKTIKEIEEYKDLFDGFQ